MPNYQDLEKGTKADTGGVTGSVRVTLDDGSMYQLKQSISKQEYLRRLKANNTDRENFVEVIASNIAIAFAGAEKAPKVSVLYDPDTKTTPVASKYLTGDNVRSLDQFIFDQVANPNKRKHMKCVAGTSAATVDQGVDGEIMQPIKQSLADAIVLSALVGDHDINPGNLLVLTKGNMNVVAKIDYGHAGNDLLNFKGLGLMDRDTDNPLLDFFNRENIAGFGETGKSKLWRDYPGMIPSAEIITALRNYSDKYQEKVAEGTLEAMNDFEDLLDQLSNADPPDIENLNHVKNSLAAIYQNVSGKEMDSSLDVHTALQVTLTEVNSFVSQNCQNAIQVANVMELQMKIEEYVNPNTSLDKKQDIKNQIEHLEKQTSLPMKDGAIQWVKISDKKPPFKGSVKEYMEFREHEMSKAASPPGSPELSSKGKDILGTLRRKINRSLSIPDFEQPMELDATIRVVNSSKLDAQTKDIAHAAKSYLEDNFEKLGEKKNIDAIVAVINVLSGVSVQNFSEKSQQLPNDFADHLSEIIPHDVIQNGNPQERVQVLLEWMTEKNQNNLQAESADKEENLSRPPSPGVIPPKNN